MSFSQFIEWVFYGSIGFAAFRMVGILDQLQASVESLNVKIAVVIQRSDNHEKRIERLEENA